MAKTTEPGIFDYLFKTIVVGDGSVGKTAITYRYAEDKFQENYKMTIGVDFTITKLVINNKTIKCQIWDTGGQERFSNIRPLYYRGALGCLVVFDVTNKESFEHLDHWFGEVTTHCRKIPIILVGNKIDIENRKVPNDWVKSYAKLKSKELGYKVPYLETSAKTGETIRKVFTDLVNLMVEEVEKALIEKESKKK